MSVWAWLGEGATLLSLVSFAICCAALTWGYRTAWPDPAQGRRFRRVNWAGVLVCGGILGFNVVVQALRYTGRV